MILALALWTGCTGEPAGPTEDDTCSAGELLDGDVCVPETCGVGTWGGLPVDGETVFVDGSAAEGGDGTEAAPLTSIQAGVDLAARAGAGEDGAGQLVAVAAGTYSEVLTMGDTHDGVTLAGRCRERVTIDGSGGSDVPAIQIVGDGKRPGIAINGVTVTAGTYSGLWIQHANVAVSASDLRENTVAGVIALDADGEFEDVGFTDSVATRSGFGYGIDVEGGATLTLTGCVIEGNTAIGVFAWNPGTTVDLLDTAVLGTLPARDGTAGHGADVSDGAALSASGCTIEGSTEVGVYASGAGTTVDLIDTAVLDTSSNADGTLGRGLEVEAGATLTATGCTIQGNTDAGVFAMDAGTTVNLIDTEILDTTAIGDGTGGEGIWAQGGAVLTATRCIVQRNTEMGVVATNTGTRVDLVDTEILETAPSPDGTFGRGVTVQNGATLTAIGCGIRRNTEVSLVVTDAGTTVVLEGTEVVDTVPNPAGGGRGIQVQDGASLTVTACLIQGHQEVGVMPMDAGTTVTLVDTAILETAAPAGGDLGRGIEISLGATLAATGCTIQGNTGTGVLAFDDGTRVDLVDTKVLETRRGRESGLALGVSPEFGALIVMRDSVISDTEGVGLYAAGGGRAEIDGVQITGNTFAAVLVLDASVSLTSSTLTDTLADAEWGGGFGIYTNATFGPPTVILEGSTIGPHDYAAVWLDGDGTYDIEGSSLAGSGGVDRGSQTLHGNALFAENGVTAWDGTSGLRLTGNTFTGAVDIGVLLSGSSADLEDNTWSGNPTDVRQQRCEGVSQLTGDDLAGIPNTLVCPTSNVLTAYDIEFNTLYLRALDEE